jgi:ubiquinone/menaquinone biosynthesis C-methylase UbiE
MNSGKKETFWSRHVDGYEDLQKSVTGEEIIDLVMSELHKETGLGRVLELGCGTGNFTEAIVENAEHITATDLSDEMITEARRLRSNFINVTFEVADATALQYQNDCFDTILMTNFIHLVDDPIKVIRESYRVLKAGGITLVSSFAVDEMPPDARSRIVNNFVNTFGVPPRVKDRPKTTTAKDIEDLLISNGFIIFRSEILGADVKASYIKGRKA